MKFGEGRGICRTCGNPARDGRSYYCAEHRPPPKTKKTSKIIEDSDLSTPTELIVETVDKVSKSRVNKSPSIDQWSKLLNPLVGWVFAVFVIWLLSYKDQPDLTEDERSELETYKSSLIPSDSDIELIMKPINRIISESEFSKTKGQTVLKNSDLVVSLFTLGNFVIQIAPIIKDRQSTLRERKNFSKEMVINNADTKNSIYDGTDYFPPTGSTFI
jgi:hypothetical protein